MAYCGHCGKYVKDGTEICPECGCYTIAKSGTKQIASSGANQVASTESKQFAFCDKTTADPVLNSCKFRL